MDIGGSETCASECPRKTKVHEHRVGLTPDSIAELTTLGASAVVEANAGAGIGFSDEDYRQAGAVIGTADDAFSAELVVKVKEPLAAECRRLMPGQVLFTYLHLAADAPQARALMHSGATRHRLRNRHRRPRAACRCCGP